MRFQHAFTALCVLRFCITLGCFYRQNYVEVNETCMDVETAWCNKPYLTCPIYILISLSIVLLQDILHQREMGSCNEALVPKGHLVSISPTFSNGFKNN